MVDHFVADDCRRRLASVLGKGVDVATEFADLVGQLGADGAESLLDGSDLFGGLPRGAVVGGYPFCQLGDLCGEPVIAGQTIRDRVHTVA